MSDETEPTISTIAESDATTHRLTGAHGSRDFVSDSAPRLYPWDWRQRRAAAPKSTDPSLANITRGRLPIPSNEAVILHPRDNPWRSAQGEQRRNAFFLMVAVASVLPFISCIALSGGFNSALSWCTQGELDHFSRGQRRFLCAEIMVSLVILTAVVVFIALKFAAQH